jgi:hypothetical protein
MAHDVDVLGSCDERESEAIHGQPFPVRSTPFVEGTAERIGKLDRLVKAAQWTFASNRDKARA